MEWIENKLEKPHYTLNSKYVKIIAEIRNNLTGEVVEFENEGILKNDEEFPSIFIWKEGNFACDCNRRIFFKTAKNELTDDIFDMECSDGEFSVNLKNKLNNYIYYKEF